MTYFFLHKELHIDDAHRYIGGLVSDIYRPSDSFFPKNDCVVVTKDDLLRPVQHTASTLLVNARERDALRLKLSQLFGLSARNAREKDLGLETKTITIYGTQDQPELFKKVVKQDQAENWMLETAEVYMLVGFISAVDAIMTAGCGSFTSATANANIAVPRVASPPGNFNAEVGVGHDSQYQTTLRGTVRGEVVFAAEYRKVKKKRFFLRAKCSLGPMYREGVMNFGGRDTWPELDDEDEMVEIEEYEYSLEEQQMDGDILLEETIDKVDDQTKELEN